jgi:chloramphenicol 3-O-phosphotransferase
VGSDSRSRRRGLFADATGAWLSASFERVATGGAMDLTVDDDAATLWDCAHVVVEAIGDLREDLVLRSRLA